jgi:methionyl-tRNA synthetase
MSRRRSYITTTIPYVNGDPHMGFALELVQADVLARHARTRGEEVRLLGGTDDNSLKNVQAAETAGVPVAQFVRARSQRLASLRGPLQLSFDDFIQTSVDARHQPGVERLWRACAAAGDLYQRDYVGLYCIGCEAFLTEQELVDGRCPEHRTEPERVSESNWFFRLSRYQETILDTIETGALRIEPEHRRNEIVSFLRSGLSDISVSRSVARAREWGIRVPGDPTQVVYVWFDALGNYISALGYGERADAYRTWWQQADRRLHVVGKGVIRFHAVYWPAFLLSAGEPLPTEIFVHDYLTFDGDKLSKSASHTLAPSDLVDRYGADALRWWCVRDVLRVGDTDFREELLAIRANELADELGNLINRVVTLINRSRPDGLRATARLSGPARELSVRAQALSDLIDAALAEFEFRKASAAIADLAADANRFISRARPWELARQAANNDHCARLELDGSLAALTETCDTLAEELRPFLPQAAQRIGQVLTNRDSNTARRLFPKAGDRGNAR